MKKIITTLLLATILSCNAPEEKTLEKLIVNNNNSIITVVNKDENAGLTDLKNLMNSAEKEEAWCYIPKDNKWIEVGESRKVDPSEKGNFSVKINLSRLYKIMDKNEELVFYHIHPAKGKCLDKCEFKEDLYVYSTLPSKEDMLFMTQVYYYFSEKQKDAKFSFKIASMYGITECVPSKIEDYSIRIKFINAYYSMIDSYLQLNFLLNRIISKCDETKKDKIDEYKKINDLCSFISDSRNLISFKKW